MKTFAFIVSFLLCFNQLNAQNRPLDSLQQVLSNTKSDTAKAMIYLEMGQALDRTSPLEALTYYEKGLELSQKSDFGKGIMDHERGIAICYIFSSQYEKAQKHTLNSMSMAQKLGNYSGLVSSYNNLGAIYIYMDRFEDAAKVYRKLITLLKEDDKKNWLSVYVNLGIIYRSREKYDSAIYYYNKGLKSAEELNLLDRQSIIYHNIGNLHNYLKQDEEAKEAFIKSIELARKVSNNNLLSTGLTNLGNVLVGMGQYNEAELLILEGIALAEKFDLKKNVSNGFKYLYSLNKEKGNTVKALEYYEIYVSRRDSIISEENNAKVSELQAKYDSENQQRENELLKKESQLQEARIKGQYRFIVAITASLLIAIILLINYYRFSLMRRKTNEKLKQLNEETMEQKEELQQQAQSLTLANQEISNINNNLERLVEERTKEVKLKNDKLIEYSFINAHKLRGPLARILGLIDILKNPKKRDDTIQVVDKLEKQGQELDEVVNGINKLLEEEGYEINTATKTYSPSKPQA